MRLLVVLLLVVFVSVNAGDSETTTTAESATEESVHHRIGGYGYRRDGYGSREGGYGKKYGSGDSDSRDDDYGRKSYKKDYKHKKCNECGRFVSFSDCPTTSSTAINILTTPDQTVGCVQPDTRETKDGDGCREYVVSCHVRTGIHTGINMLNMADSLLLARDWNHAVIRLHCSNESQWKTDAEEVVNSVYCIFETSATLFGPMAAQYRAVYEYYRQPVPPVGITPPIPPTLWQAQFYNPTSPDAKVETQDTPKSSDTPKTQNTPPKTDGAPTVAKDDKPPKMK